MTYDEAVARYDAAQVAILNARDADERNAATEAADEAFTAIFEATR